MRDRMLICVQFASSYDIAKRIKLSPIRSKFKTDQIFNEIFSRTKPTSGE